MILMCVLWDSGILVISSSNTSCNIIIVLYVFYSEAPMTLTIFTVF